MSAADSPRPQRSVSVSHWLRPDDTDCEVTAWKVDDGAERHPELASRMTLTFQSGSATLHIRPTRAEAFQLITLLEWALELGTFAVPYSTTLPPARPASEKTGETATETAGARP